uniref:TEP1-F n=1 Tax=Glossina pallidipes TaxID=7398 RepID=A0A1B0ABH2_GLOPL
MFQNICLVYCILHLLWPVRGSGIYSIVAPKTLQSNHKYSVSVTLHDAKQPVTFNIGITGPSYNHSETVNLTPIETTQVDFVLPELDGGPYRLITKGIEGLDFTNATELHLAQSMPKVYIQTDKAMYKPGDLVQYRILVLDENLRPLKSDRRLGVAIKDAANNIIKDIKNIQLVKGVFSDKLQLTEQPVLGLWIIEVSLSDRLEKTKEFEVAKYVLPKFSVDIDAVPDLAITESSFKITVRAKYTYGKPVKGKATVRLSPINLEKTIDMNGKGYVEFDLRKDLNILQKESVRELKAFAMVEEELTGNKQNATVKINLHYSPYIIEVFDVMTEHEVNQPFEVKVVIKHLNGKPVQDTKTPVLLNYYSRWGEYKNAEIFKANLDEHGVAIIKVNFQNDGFYWCELKFADEVKRLPSVGVAAARKKNAELLTLELETIRPQLGEYVSIAVKAPKVMTHLIYTVVGRGNILHKRNIPLPNPQSLYTISFRTTFEMIPKVHVFVYYVDEGDLKFEEIGIKIQPEFENKIEITGPSQAKPGQEVTLNIKTDPNSYVGLLGVDQSVLLLKSGNDLDLSAILNDLKSYKSEDEHQDEFSRYIYKVPGENSGLMVMTNAHYPYKDQRIVMSYAIHGAGPYYLLSSNPEIETSRTFPEYLTPSAGPERIRKDFAEIWLFENLDDNNETGHLTLNKSLPDTITSWVISAFAVNEKTGLGMTENPFK